MSRDLSLEFSPLTIHLQRDAKVLAVNEWLSRSSREVEWFAPAIIFAAESESCGRTVKNVQGAYMVARQAEPEKCEVVSLTQSNLRSKGGWTGKVVLITGASDGIGASCARLMGQRGAKLALTALANDHFQNEASASRLIIAGDITSDKTRIEVIKRTIECFGRIDVLINNAGVGHFGYPTEVDMEISRRLFDVNVFRSWR